MAFNIQKNLVRLDSRGPELSELLARVAGGLTPEEGRALSRHAADAGAGVLLEIGDDGGQAAVALAHGLKAAGPAPGKRLYRVDPEPGAARQGGGVDRSGFYRAVLDTGIHDCVRVINQPSAEVAEGWQQPISLLLINGEGSYDSVASDVERWVSHVAVGGVLVFARADKPELGAARCVEELLTVPAFRAVETVGGLSFIRKVAEASVRPRVRPIRRFLVVCEQPFVSGSMLRFARLARVLERGGHRLAFGCLERPHPGLWNEECELISFAEAALQDWDVSMVPGAGFSPAAVAQLSVLNADNFGLRVQHVLNSPRLRSDFLAVNRSLRPNLVVFNNQHWSPGSYTEFQADRFYTLEGAVDCERFSPLPYKAVKSGADTIVLGAQARKNPACVLAALRLLPDHFELELVGDLGRNAPPHEDLLAGGRLRLLGSVGGDQMPALYQGWDAVIQAEPFAGWANLVAEGMASGVPAICSEAGTLALATHGETALLANPTGEAIAAQALRLFSEPGLAEGIARRARLHVARYDWNSYADSFQRMCFEDSGFHYTHEPEVGLHGKWPVAYRLHGLDPLLAAVAGKRVIDLGCAEGVVARACYQHGAVSVLGLEYEEDRVELAAKLCAAYRNPVFVQVDLSNWPSLHAVHGSLLDAGADITLYLGIHQHLPPATRGEVFTQTLQRTGEMLVLRCPTDVFEGDGMEALAEASGFQIVQHTSAGADTPFGDTWYLTRGGVPIVNSGSTPSTGFAGSAGPTGSARSSRRNRPLVEAGVDRRFISYPKSGRTWLRYAFRTMGLDHHVKFAHDRFEFNDGSKPAHSFDPQDRRERYRGARVLYLSRDPRDLIISLYHQITGRFVDFYGYTGTLSDFIRDDYFGAQSLQRFRGMWDGLCAEGVALHVDYAQLHTDFSASLGEIAEHLRLPTTPESIERAREAAHIDRMREVEAKGEFAEPWLRTRNGHAKVRVGKVGGYRDVLNATDLEYLNGVFALPTDD